MTISGGHDDKVGLKARGNGQRRVDDRAVQAELHEHEEDGEGDPGNRHRGAPPSMRQHPPGQTAPAQLAPARRDHEAPTTKMRTWPSRLVRPAAAPAGPSRMRTCTTRTFAGAVGSSPKTSLR